MIEPPTLFIIRPKEKVASLVGSELFRRQRGTSLPNFGPIKARQ
jgi:hypothetical protein